MKQGKSALSLKGKMSGTVSTWQVLAEASTHATDGLHPLRGD
jgi:hypothetical protein